jgi:glycosyltransferase involved in cell wall biosynthesis
LFKKQIIAQTSRKYGLILLVYSPQKKLDFCRKFEDKFKPLFLKVAIIHIRLMHKGGLETRLFNYMNYFLARGDEVTILSSKVSPTIQLPPEVKLVKHDLSKYPRIIRHLLFSQWLEKYLSAHLFDYSLSLERTWGQQRIIAPNTHIGYVLAQKKWWRTPSDLIQIYLDKKAFRLTPHIYACSNMVKNEIVEQYKVPTNKITVLFPPLNTSQFNVAVRQNRSEFQHHYGIDDAKINFVFVSTSHKRKGLDLLLQLFSTPAFRHLQLYIAGSTIKYSSPNIHSLGFVMNTAALYAAVDCVLHPSVYEPFGQVIAESIACGTYAIVSDHVGAKEIINDKVGQVLPVSDIQAWYDAIIHFKKVNLDPAEINRLADLLSLEQHMQVLTK